MLVFSWIHTSILAICGTYFLDFLELLIKLDDFLLIGQLVVVEGEVCALYLNERQKAIVMISHAVDRVGVEGFEARLASLSVDIVVSCHWLGRLLRLLHLRRCLRWLRRRCLSRLRHLYRLSLPCNQFSCSSLSDHGRNILWKELGTIIGHTYFVSNQLVLR